MEKIILIISQKPELVLLVRLILVIILSGIIGYQREHWSKPAGFRTHILLGISGVLVAYIGYAFSNIDGNVDATRIAAQLLPGIGFIGAGTILREGKSIRGLTTAATLLTVTCIGICIGFGLYIPGIITTIITYLILSYSHFITGKYSDDSDLHLLIHTENPKKIINELKDLLNSNKIDIISLSINNSKKSSIELKCKSNSKLNKNTIISKIMVIDNIFEINDLKEEYND